MRFFAVALIILGVTMPSVASAKPSRIAVVGTRPVDDKDRGSVYVSAQLTIALRAEVPSARAITVGASFLERIAKHGCTNEPACIAEIGRDLGADYVIYGTLDRSPRDLFPATVMLVDVAHETIVTTIKHDIPHGDGTEAGIRLHAKQIVAALAP